MAKLLCLAALLAVSATSAHAQTAAIHPAADTTQERQGIRDLTVCLAEARPRWARKTLAYPYLSTAQAREATSALSGNDTCMMKPEAEFTFRTSSLVGSLAEHFVVTDISRVDFARLGTVLSTLKPLNASEDFALCIASRNPAAARDLALSQPGSATETSAAKLLSNGIAPCTNVGETLTVDLQSLRALVSVALYRGVTTILAPKS